MSQSGWLDPEPPHAEHTELECRRELPKPRPVDQGRRWACSTCGRVYQAKDGGQMDGMGFVLLPDPPPGPSGVSWADQRGD